MSFGPQAFEEPPPAGAREPVRPGQALAGLGAIGLIVSLFLKWYGIGLPAGADQALADGSQGLPDGYQQFAQQFGQALLESFSNLGGNAWEMFEFADVALLACAVAALGATLVAMGVISSLRRAAGDLANVTRIAGVVAIGIVVVKMLDQPDPAEIWQLESGPYVALAAAAMVAFGGAAASRSR
jgi:hypothetical protein